jgi:putative tricarboxylic transport membrane protein
MSMRRPYQITGGLLLLFSIFVGYKALQLRYYTGMGPGPGFFSFWLAVILAVLATVMIATATLGRPEPMPKNFFSNREGYLRIGAIILALVFTIQSLEWLGFPITMFAVCAFLISYLGRRGIALTLVLSFASGFGVYYLFDRLLRVPLPKGLLGF